MNLHRLLCISASCVFLAGCATGPAPDDDPTVAGEEQPLTSFAPTYDVVVSAAADERTVGPPVIATDGSAYVMLFNRGNGTGRVQAVAPDGALRASSPAFPVDSNVGFGLGLDDDGNVYAQELTCRRVGSPISSGLCSGALLSFTPSLVQRWRSTLFVDRPVWSWYLGLESPRFDTITKNIYARIGSVAAVTKAGAVRWQVDAVSANAFDIDANGDVLVAGSQGSSCWLERHAADGAVKWTNRSSLDPVPCVRSLRIVPDGNVMLSADGRLSEMSATGAITPLARTPSATCFQCTVRTPFTLMRGDRAAALWSASGTQFTLVASRRDGSAAWERPKVGEFGVAAYGGGVLAQAVEAGTLCALGAAGNVRACFTPNAGSRRWGVGVAVSGNEVFALLAVASGNSPFSSETRLSRLKALR